MIKFVYFDVGGVAIFDFSGTRKWDELRHSLGVNDLNAQKFEKIWDEYGYRLCLDFDVDSLLSILTKELGLHFPKGYSLLQDFVNRFEVNPSIYPIIQSIEQTTKVGLLTNMYPRMLDAINKRSLLPPVDWDAVIDSSVVGCRKPEIEIFKLAEKKAGVSHDEILFVENGEENIRAAEKFGWKILLYETKYPEKSNALILEMIAKE